ncbi:MAG TPA: primosomal protein N' [Methylomirabilota bacterium]|nr:primosomal protein N' [Methylomirabilota bacterium]
MPDSRSVTVDVAFDTPVQHPFSYLVPEGMTVRPGQRVAAPLGRGVRTGMVVAVREGDAAGLKPLARLVDRAPVLDARSLDLARWIAEQSLSSLGSTLVALTPPGRTGREERSREPSRTAHPRFTPSSPSDTEDKTTAQPHLFIGHGRERRLLERIAGASAPTLVIVPEIDAAARWAQRLEKHGSVARLDSGVDDDTRARAWAALAAGDARLAVGTRGALLAPLPAGATIALVDEHEAAHKPPGPPRLHSRDVVLERAARAGLDAVLTSATPSVETWWRADSGRARLVAGERAPWPAVQVTDTRGILRREPLTPVLARAVRETLAAGRRALLVVSRVTSALACDECGAIVRCPDCDVALAYARAARALTCRVCGRETPLPETCAGCRGRRLSPFGWNAERVEHAVRRRFPKARVARYDPEARGAKAERGRAEAAAAEIVIGTRGALRLFGPAALGVAGFVAPDQLLRLPDFRAGERLFSLLWAAAERVAPGGQVIVQSQTPEHYAFDACARQDLDAFYGQEMKFRGELGYPPFRRLAIITLTGPSPAVARGLGDDVSAALAGVAGLTVYPPVAVRRDRARRIVVKGHADLASRLAEALAEFRGPRPKSRGIMDVEVDPVEWPS